MIQPRFKEHERAMWRWYTRGRGRHYDWFDKNPDRETRLATISLQRLGDLAWSGYFVGCASALSGKAKFGIPRQGVLRVEPDLKCRATNAPHSFHCIVRRPDPAQGRPLPGVFLLDGMTTPSAPPSGAPAPDADEEAFCAAWWDYADAMRAMGLVLRWKPSEIDWTPDYGGLIDSVAWRSEVPFDASMAEIMAAQGRLVREAAEKQSDKNSQN